MANFPLDRFDEQPDDLLRVGAHRAPRKKGRTWINFAWAALATGILIVGGLYGLSRVTDGIAFELPFGGEEPVETPTATDTPTAEPLLDPAALDPARNVTITVLNGTPTSGLHNTVGDSLSTAGWPVGAQSRASADDVEETFVYYNDAANEDVARGVAIALGVGGIRLSDAFAAPITIVLGADYPTE